MRWDPHLAMVLLGQCQGDLDLSTGTQKKVYAVGLGLCVEY